MSGGAAIHTTDLLVEYRTEAGLLRALDCDALTVDSGKSVAITGQSGSGKSTLLGLIAGLAVPTAGTVAIGSHVISALAPDERVAFRRRELGMVYQSDNLLPHLTVEENVGLQLAICGGAGDPSMILARLGLAGLAHRLPDQLSGGERQRVAVARAVVHGPRVIVADEPTGALDSASAGLVINLLVELHQELGATLVVVTHDPVVAGHLHRIVRLERRQARGDLSDAA